MLAFRPFNVGDLEYILVTRKESKSPFLPPPDFDDGFFYSLRTYPRSTIQLNNPIEHFRWIKFTRKETPLRFLVLYETDIELHIQRDFLVDTVKIIFLDKTTSNKGEIVDVFRKHYKTIFFVFLGHEGDKEKIANGICRNANDLIEQLQINRKEVEELLSKIYKNGNLKFEVNLQNEEGNEFNTPVYFRPAQVNYFTLNQAIGNYWYHYTGDSEEELISISKKAVTSEIDDQSRFKTIIDTVDRIDSLEMNCHEKSKAKLPNFYDYKLAPLIIIAPSSYPHLKDLFEAKLKKDKALKIVLKSIGFEQRLNYTNYIDADDIEKNKEEAENIIQQVAYFQKNKLHYLDGMSYLHAQFRSSPVIRFPFLGNKIKKELSFFRPEASIRNQNSLKILFDEFGKAVIKNTIPEGYVNTVFNRARQIVAITDLPLEWLNIEGLPLSLTHDVTRIPEHPLSGIMTYNAMNTTFKVEITKDILRKTLVLFCASEKDDNYEIFYGFYKKVQELSLELGFVTAICKSVADVIELISKHQPDLLIFDCHGQYDPDTLSSYLVINNEKLDGEAIVRNKISAPIVFLSACFTNPTYGYVNGIANAFFEAGSLAVTATYFPISIDAGSVLYLRLLKNLEYASKIPVHNNWLEFVCHVIRTSYIMSIHITILNQLELTPLDNDRRTKLSKKLTNMTARINTGLMSFDHRFSIMKEYESELRKAIEVVIPSFKIDFNSLIPEHLFYTNLGRGDLIVFNCWLDKYYDLNDLKS